MRLQARRVQALLAAVVSTLLVLCAIWAYRSARDAMPFSGTPAFYEEAPTKLPPVLESKWFSDPETKESYEAARINAKLFSQLPCYCYCDRSSGHKSLHSCFVDEHGAECSICKREALFAASQAKQGRSTAEIREKIIRGLWQ